MTPWRLLPEEDLVVAGPTPQRRLATCRLTATWTLARLLRFERLPRRPGPGSGQEEDEATHWTRQAAGRGRGPAVAPSAAEGHGRETRRGICPLLLAAVGRQ